MARQLRRAAVCLNCGQPVDGNFCAECGQENTDYRVSLRRLLGDAFDELFQLESRLWRSLWLLFRLPGLLTCEYVAGRRVRYTTPLRLYLIASVGYFFLAGVRPPHAVIKADAGDATALQREIAQTPAGWRRNLLEQAAAAERDPKAAAARARAAVVEWVPRVMALLVPIFGLLTFAFFRRRRFYVEHLVFALHVHAVAFLLLAVGELADMRWVGRAITIALLVWTFVAARRVFDERWRHIAWKLPIVGLLYACLLGAGIAAALVFGGSLLVL
jgi:hypothetical protein